MNKRVIFVSLFLVGLLVLAGITLSGNKKKAAEKIYKLDTTAKVLVETVTPTDHIYDNELSFLGTFEPNRENNVASETSGKVIRVAVQVGDYVSAGQLIAKVDDEMLNLQLEGAQINLEGQKNDDVRNSDLIQKEAITSVQVEKTKLSVRSAEIQIKQLKKQMKTTSIVAPFSGYVTKRMFDLGTVLGPGSPLIELVDIGSLKLTVSVPERDVLKFSEGKAVTVSADVYPGKPFKGKVSMVGIKGDAAHNFTVQMLVSNSKETRLMAGMYGSVLLESNGSKKVISIPRKALIGSMKKPEVYLVINGKAVKRSFTMGTSDSDFVEVISGINADEKVVFNGQINLREGSNVQIK